MTPPRKGKRYICSIHDEIGEIARDLEIELSEILADGIIDKLQRIQHLVEEAKVAGQAMEDKLREYKVSVELIGLKKNQDKDKK